MKRNKMRRMSTAQLDALLQEELRKDTPDEGVVIPILEMLEDREQKPQRKPNWIINAAAVAAVFALLIALMPKAVGADSVMDVFVHLTDSVLQFFTPGEQPAPTESEYTFQTDNPGLQQLYDKVAALGITDPIVPTWLPEGYELAEFKITSYDNNEKICSTFKKNDEFIVMVFKILADETVQNKYERQNGQLEIYERGGIGHVLTNNDEKWTATWVRTDVECMITVNIEKDDLRKIIVSIYGRN